MTGDVMLKDGMFIQNRYEIISRIGSGGMADVYKAKDHKLNRFVAVKVLKKEYRDDKAFISKFQVEAQSAAGLAHANIVNIYDVGEEAGIYYIVMELVEGITLKAYIEKKGRLSVREATSIALQISAGLEAAHNSGVIHRDVKPQNILISVDGRVKVADFGIARASTSNTINSNVMGSVHYSSPEQARGGYSDEKSDIYSLGITMYEMLTGHVPFDGDTAVSVAIKHLQEELHGPKENYPEIPLSTNRIVLKCTQKSPDRRYANMSELIRDLRESLVNPDGDFVKIPALDNKAQTIIMSKAEVDQINASRMSGQDSNMPSYDESLDVGAAAGLRGQEGEPKQPDRAYQPGSYYRKSGYQAMDPGRPGTPARDPENDEDHEDFASDYDVYDERDNYGFQEKNYHSDKAFAEDAMDDVEEIGINSRLERAVTIGGILVAVIIGCIFLALLANAFGLLNFMKRSRSSGKPQTVETTTEAVTGKTQTAQTEKAAEPATSAAVPAQTPETENVSPTESVAVTEMPVPSVMGRTEDEAISLLRESGFTPVRGENVSSAEYAAGSVCSQTPAADTAAKTGDEVIYLISTGTPGVPLDPLAGMERSEAEAYLAEKGYNCLADTSQYNEEVPQGYVISTYPEAGTLLHEGDSVTLYISQGSTADIRYVTVPDFYYTDQETSALRAELTGLGAPNYVYEPSTSVQNDWVCRQSVAQGERVPAGTVITLYLSSGPNGEGGGDTASQNAQSSWRCNAQLEVPTNYNGEQVLIELVQGDVVTTVYEGYTSFPYLLQVQGAEGASTGTARVTLLDDEGNSLSVIEYPGILFSESGVNP